MENALNMPQKPEELLKVVQLHETTGNDSMLQRTRKTQAGLVLSLIDQHPEEHKDLLIVTSETLREEITKKMETGNLGRFSVGFYSDVANYIKISELLDDGFNAWELVREVAALHLNFYDKIKGFQFIPADNDLISKTVNILRLFNRQIPGIYEAIEMQAEAELLYANFLSGRLNDNLLKKSLSYEAIDVAIENVRVNYETSLNTVLLRMTHPDEEKEEAFELLEDIAVSYGDWLLSIGEEESAKDLCEEVYMRNPNTHVYESLGFVSPAERSLRKRATQNAIKPEEPVRANADMQMTPFTKQAKAEGLQLETLLNMYEGRVIAAVKTLEVLAETDTKIAQQTSRSISGGYPLFKDPYSHNDPNKNSYNN